MNIPFYLNPETLGKRHLSAQDLIVAVVLLGFLLWAGFAFTATVEGGKSLALRTGAGLSYTGLICGIFLHLAKQTKRGDEFSQKIITQSLAKAGLATAFQVSIMTLLEGAFDFMNNVQPELWASFAPILLLVYAYIFARFAACSYVR